MTQDGPIDTQDVDALLTDSALFLVLTLTDAPGALDQVRAVLGGVADIVKNVAFRAPAASFACTVSVGSRVWRDVMRTDLPRELHEFVPVVGGVHTAVSTPGDLFFHVRANRRDVCFEFERQLLDQFGQSVTVADETVGFRYFDARDLLAFVDGTANPSGRDRVGSTLVGDEDPRGTGGSYVVIQKYFHDIPAWQALSTEQQETIIGRSKADNRELADPSATQKSHRVLATITDENGEHDILRDNMPFGSPGSGEFGTYFVGYSRQLWVIERMLQRMFVGDPPGSYDKLLDFSRAVTGTVFFAPPADALAALAD